MIIYTWDVWLGRFDVTEKLFQIEEMTERNLSLSGIECGKSTFGEGTEKPSFREGEGIALAMASPTSWGDDKDMGHFLPQKSVKIKRTGYNIVLTPESRPSA